MIKKIVLMLICGALGSTFSFNVRALPISSTPSQARGPNITFVAGGCGIGFHRGPYGACLRNGVYAPVVVAPYGTPVVVAPYGAPVVAPRPVCPYGYHLGPYGRCYPLLKCFRVMPGHLPV